MNDLLGFLLTEMHGDHVKVAQDLRELVAVLADAGVGNDATLHMEDAEMVAEHLGVKSEFLSSIVKHPITNREHELGPGMLCSRCGEWYVSEEVSRSSFVLGVPPPEGCLGCCLKGPYQNDCE